MDAIPQAPAAIQREEPMTIFGRVLAFFARLIRGRRPTPTPTPTPTTTLLDGVFAGLNNSMQSQPLQEDSAVNAEGIAVELRPDGPIPSAAPTEVAALRANRVKEDEVRSVSPMRGNIGAGVGL